VADRAQIVADVTGSLALDETPPDARSARCSARNRDSSREADVR